MAPRVTRYGLGAQTRCASGGRQHHRHPARHELLGYVLQAKGSSGLLAKDIANRDDPDIPMTAAEFLAKAWRAANDKARDLGWIV